MTPLPKLHAGSPLFTNAFCNRKAAQRAFAAGVTAAQIAAYWPEVFTLDAEGKLGQKYDYELADGSGRFETTRQITAGSVTACIRHFTARATVPALL